jgi:hypothetical protein
LKQGVHRISNDIYHSGPCEIPSLSRGTIVNLLDCPAKAWWNHPKLNTACPKQENERKFNLGSAVHDYVLEGGKKIQVIFGYDDWKKKDARELADLSFGSGMIPLLEKQFLQVQAIGEAAKKTIYGCPELGITDLIADGDAELSYFWDENGTRFRTRLDWISKDKKLILDLKTSNSADPDEFSRKIENFGYCVQDSLYRRGVHAVDGTFPELIFIIVETEAPYLCSIVSLSAEFQELGNQKVEAAIKLWNHCLKTGQWPGYPVHRVAWLEAKPWMISNWESKKYDIEKMIEGY